MSLYDTYRENVFKRTSNGQYGNWFPTSSHVKSQSYSGKSRPQSEYLQRCSKPLTSSSSAYTGGGVSLNGYGSSPSSHVIVAAANAPSSPAHRSNAVANSASSSATPYVNSASSHAPSYPAYHVSHVINAATPSSRLSYDVGTMLLNTSHATHATHATPHYNHHHHHQQTGQSMTHQASPSAPTHRYTAAHHHNHYSDYNPYEYHIQEKTSSGYRDLADGSRPNLLRSNTFNPTSSSCSQSSSANNNSSSCHASTNQQCWPYANPTRTPRSASFSAVCQSSKNLKPILKKRNSSGCSTQEQTQYLNASSQVAKEKLPTLQCKNKRVSFQL